MFIALKLVGNYFSILTMTIDPLFVGRHTYICFMFFAAFWA